VVAFCGLANDQQLAVAVSTEATDVTIENGYPRLPVYNGGEFLAYGIPSLYDDDGMLVSPERAVQIGFGATGRRIAALPQAIRRGNDLGYSYFQGQALWRITLEDSVSFETHAGAIRRADVVWISKDTLSRPVVMLPSEDQPLTVPAVVHDFDSMNVAFVHTLDLRVVAPVRFDTVIATVRR
jgi:hypothetical protein